MREEGARVEHGRRRGDLRVERAAGGEARGLVGERLGLPRGLGGKERLEQPHALRAEAERRGAKVGEGASFAVW